MKIKLISSFLILFLGSSAFADMEFICRSSLSGHPTMIDSFYFQGAFVSLEEAAKVVHRRFDSSERSEEPSSVREKNTYEIVKTQVLGKDDFLIHLEGNGSLKVKYSEDLQKWQGYFVRPGGPEIAQVLNDCEQLNFEIGFTAHN